MGYEDRGIAEFTAELAKTNDLLSRGDRRIDELARSIDDLYRRGGRPGSSGEIEVGDERKAARELCVVKHALDVPKTTGDRAAVEYSPSSAEIDSAVLHAKAMKQLIRHGDPGRLDGECRKSLTTFSLGTNDWLMPTTWSSRVLSCLVDPTDLTGLVSNEAISGPSIKFPIDSARMNLAAWACETSCFPNNPQPDLQGGLGELEIKAESIRHIVCASRDLLEDASFSVENWLLRKASLGYREALSAALILGDGNGRPLGLLHPRSGVPICETGPATAPGSLTWQDLVMLKWEIPQQWHAGGVYVMNQRTFAQVMTMTDAAHRPIFAESLRGEPGYMLAGSPIVVASQMPDVQPGSTTVLFGNLREAYTMVTRRALTMVVDNYTAGWCTLFKFDARVGGAPLCSNAARLLRIR